ncbi:hypothetical protein ACHWQZ_G016398 [Mnemiopsis leidyi]
MDATWIEIYFLTAFLKLFLFHSYHSTDFEVHRNWLAITHSLPIDKWYYESTSQWTLDYPPFFAWFEYLLSTVAGFFDPGMLKISETPYFNRATLLFQRSSVILSDIALCYACSRVFRYVKLLGGGKFSDLNVKMILTACYMCCAGLLIVDHVHFQYNGFLSGIFLLSLVNVASGNIVWGGFYFSVLLNFKHIYLYCAPVYFVYMLRVHMFHENTFLGVDLVGLIKLGGCVILVFSASLGPFLNHLPQILSRLFPVQRGLCHAYWAPNFWTLYNLLDICLSKVLQIFHILPKTGVHPLMSGLVQQADFLVLPNVSPVHSATLTLVALTPVLVKLFKNPSPGLFLKSATAAAFTSFLLGYHVHEKAILVILVPYAMLVFSDVKHARDYYFLSFHGTYSLFPLLFEAQEFLVKIVILLMVHSFMSITLARMYPDLKLNMFEKLYLVGLVFHFLSAEVILPLLLPHLEFLPLLLYSAYCSIGVGYSYIKLYTKL